MPRAQLYHNLRAAILSDGLRSGERLPSTRDLAERLGTSRTVVLLAYDQLLAEGFAVGRRGSGTYASTGAGAVRAAAAAPPVKLRLTRFGSAAAAAWSRVNIPPPRTGPLPYDFVYGRSDLETFPFGMWRRLLLRSARRAPTLQLDYGPAAGSVALREAICSHLRRSRAVSCDPSQVLIVNGSQRALNLISRVLIEPGDSVAIEDPGYQGTREVLDASVALLDWAKRTRAAIVEDDYDGEFRYAGQPLESLQGLDGGARVIYLGTFSRTVFAALRIGYIVAPKSLVRALTSAKWLSDRHTATLEQETLAEFISCGMYERYLRRVRHRNARRREALLEAMRKYLGDRIEVSGDDAGAHVVLWLRERVAEQAVITGAAARGVGVYPVSPYFLKPPPRSGLMLGYSRLPETEIREGIRRLSELL